MTTDVSIISEEEYKELERKVFSFLDMYNDMESQYVMNINVLIMDFLLHMHHF